MALRLACKKFMTQQQHQLMSKSSSSFISKNRSFAAAAASPTTVEDTSTAPTVFDKIISLTIVDPSGARRKINGMVGK
jgi:hypothetical protein